MGVIVKLRVSRVVRLFVCFVVCGKCRHLCFGIFVFSGFPEQGYLSESLLIMFKL